MDAKTGELDWISSATPELIAMSRHGSPVASSNGKFIIVPYLSGEMVAYSIDDGAEAWRVSLISENTANNGMSMSHIAVPPVSDEGRVFAATVGSKMAAFNESSGVVIWEREIGTLSPIVVQGGWCFVLSSDNTVACLSADNGDIKWATSIHDLLRKQGKKPANELFCGPLIINGEVVVFGYNGYVFTIDASSGSLKRFEESQTFRGVSSLPIIVGGCVYVLSEDGIVTKLG
jgi:outer membrane protein assembly factor BamB